MEFYRTLPVDAGPAPGGGGTLAGMIAVRPAYLIWSGREGASAPQTPSRTVILARIGLVLRGRSGAAVGACRNTSLRSRIEFR
jgi:hypothetical protein